MRGWDTRIDSISAGPIRLPATLDCVVAPPQYVPVAVLVDLSPIPMTPNAGPARPVCLDISLRIFPESSRHPDPGLADDQLADPVPDRAPVFINNVCCNAGARPAKGARLDGRKRISHQDPAGNFRAAGIVNDRQLFPANLFEQPPPGGRIPGFSGRRQHSQMREVMLHPRFDPSCDDIARTRVGEIPRMLTRLRAQTSQSRLRSGKSGAPSYRTMVAPRTLPHI